MPIDLKEYEIILGSASIPRQRVLVNAGYNPRIITVKIDEKNYGDRKDPRKLTLVPLEVARAKRGPILEKIGLEKQKALLITADQASIYKDEIWEKPDSADEIRRRLELLMNEAYTLQFWNGYTVTNLWTGQTLEKQDCSAISLRKIPLDCLEKILAEPEFRKCSSGIMTEHPLCAPYVCMAFGGSMDSNFGLSLRLVEGMMTELLKEV